MSHHDGSKPYQPRRGPERHPQPVVDAASSLPAVVAPAVDQLAAAAAEAELMNNYIEQHHHQLQQGHEQEIREEEEEEEDEEMEEENDGAEGDGQEGGVAGEHVPMDAEAAAAAAAAAAVAASGMQMDPHGAMVPTTLPPVSNQLTLSFQGEVYVFDSVSPDKVPLMACRL
jgi:TolA-binding protein